MATTTPAAAAAAASVAPVRIAPVNITPAFFTTPLVEYDRAMATSSFAGIPRFGHTDQFADLTTEPQDYVLGLLFVGCFLLTFFLLWSFVLLLFKYCVDGFLSGEPFVNPHLLQQEDPTLHEDDEEEETPRHRNRSKKNGPEIINADILIQRVKDEEDQDTKWLERPRTIRCCKLLYYSMFEATNCFGTSWTSPHSFLF
jgi:hypothetical protein